MSEDTHDLGEEALACLASWFSRPKNVLTSHEPHFILNKVRGGMNELVSKGLVTERAFNNAGSVQFTSTEEGSRIGRAEQNRLMDKLFVPAAPAQTEAQP